MQFDNKIVLVTGASRGIGREVAKQFVDRGATLAIHYNRNQEAAEATQSQLTGDRHIIVQANMDDPVGIQKMVESVIEQLGRIDILVNNAGIYEEHTLTNVSYEAWQAHFHKTLNVNLVGVANTIYCVAQHMIKQGGGRIVNISSRGAFRGEPNAPAYGASKAGMNSMGQSLAKLLAPHNIFIGTVAPGYVETDMAAHILSQPRGEEIRNQSPLGRVAKPEEVAHVALFLASEGAEFTTGTIVDINGASYLRS